MLAAPNTSQEFSAVKLFLRNPYLRNIILFLQQEKRQDGIDCFLSFYVTACFQLIIKHGNELKDFGLKKLLAF